MTNRTITTAVAGRSSSMRRLRRRAAVAQRPYCSTNGCTSYLELDATTGVAECPVCGYRRRLH
jgi:bacterioferritin-associated ferredoxin